MFDETAYAGNLRDQAESTGSLRPIVPAIGIGSQDLPGFYRRCKRCGRYGGFHEKMNSRQAVQDVTSGPV